MRVRQGVPVEVGSVMTTCRRWMMLVLVVLCSSAGRVRAASLDPAMLPTIQAATFEVVAAKPVVDPITYEKPLPLELLPYQQRTDKYNSIGTAFAIGNHRYVTAGHVLLSALGSLWGPLSLRDASGHVYAIDKIEKFSLRRDFVVFTLASEPHDSAAFELDAEPKLNQVVYAVGNALGTGVVIRDGLYTSNTPEQQDGSWKWMRFSAAASPGNSGGPLLDKEGKVIGVVLMKSVNENLNYALPISEVLHAPDHLAVIDERVPYQFDVFDATLSNIFKAKFALPKRLADFLTSFQRLRDAYVDQQLKALLAQESGRLFPRGSGSDQLLHSAPRLNSFPALIIRDSNGHWGLSVRPISKTMLSANGYVAMGVAGHSLFFHLRKPDDVAAKQFYSDAGKFMDLLIKPGFMTRQVGSEKIKVISMGKPVLDKVHVDAWGRRWQVREWPVPFGNSRIITFSLPVPDGYVTMAQPALASSEHEHMVDMQALTDFVDVAYDGTIGQWKDYLKNTPLLPAAFDDIRIDLADRQRFSYSSKRMGFSFTPKLQAITSGSELTLGFSYFRDQGKVVWGVGGVRVKVDPDDPDGIDIRRHLAPSADLDDDYKSEWRKLVKQQHPYDGIAFSVNDVMWIDGVVSHSANAPGFLYTASYDVEGNRPQNVMKAKLDLLMKNIHVREH